MLALAIKLVVILGVLSGEAAGQSTLVECDSGKIALTSVPFMKTPAADACGANALGGKSIRSIFEFSVTPPDTIAKMVNTPSCQTWWSDLSAPFALFKPCTYLGMSIQDFSNMPLQEFLEANNQEILLSFGPNQPADTSPMEIDDKGSAAPPSPVATAALVGTMAAVTSTLAPPIPTSTRSIEVSTLAAVLTQTTTTPTTQESDSTPHALATNSSLTPTIFTSDTTTSSPIAANTTSPVASQRVNTSNLPNVDTIVPTSLLSTSNGKTSASSSHYFPMALLVAVVIVFGFI